MNFDKEPLTIKKDKSSISMSIENPRLVLGEYAMIIYIYDKMRQVLFWMENCARFQISNLNNDLLANTSVKSPIVPNVKIIEKPLP